MMPLICSSNRDFPESAALGLSASDVVIAIEGYLLDKPLRDGCKPNLEQLAKLFEIHKGPRYEPVDDPTNQLRLLEVMTATGVTIDKAWEFSEALKWMINHQEARPTPMMRKTLEACSHFMQSVGAEMLARTSHRFMI